MEPGLLEIFLVLLDVRRRSAVRIVARGQPLDQRLIFLQRFAILPHLPIGFGQGQLGQRLGRAGLFLGTVGAEALHGAGIVADRVRPPRQLAERLAFGYVNSGACYRAVTWHVITSGTRPESADAVAALLGVREVQDYEGQAAMELEALVDGPEVLDGGWKLEDGVLSFAPLLNHIARFRPDARLGASLFHGTLIDGLAALAADGASRTGTATVVLGGGCMMNRVLAEGLTAALAVLGLKPLMARRLPPNDGGLSYGQVALARQLQ